jgi:prepilin-type N-terminal cleavage/methylation domain-containing protein
VPSTEHTHPRPGRAGFTLTEILVAVTLLGVLSLGMFGNIMMHQRSFRYNVASNRNIQDSSMALQRIVYGDGDHWGLRIASRSNTVVNFTGETGANGSLGWQAVYRHHIPIDDDTPAHLSTPVQTLVYSPASRTLTLNGTVIASNVADAYFTFNGTVAALGLQTVNDTFGLESMVETRCKLRNR